MIINRYAGFLAKMPRTTYAGKALRGLKHTLTRKGMERDLAGKLDKQTMFDKVEIETVNRCNGVCPFCPVSRGNDIRKLELMTDELFAKIIGELHDMDYAGHLALFSNNEPLIDKKIVERIKFARENVPRAFLYIYTNGSLLTPELTREIAPYLDRIVIDNYDDSLELTESVKKIHEMCEKDKALDAKIHIHVRKLNETLYTRGGQAPNNSKKSTLRMPCVFPSTQMVIRPGGGVSLCCNDAYGRVTLGDCNTQSLREIWYSEKHMEYRRELCKSDGRSKFELCRYCDTL